MASKETLQIAGLVQDSIVDGPGIRYTIFTQGCPHRCEGCHNPETHDFSGGSSVPLDQIKAEISCNPLLDGVTLSGGEPFVQAEGLIQIAAHARALGLSVWIYSGWTYEELMDQSGQNESVRKLLDLCDVLVDGRFEHSLRSLSLEWRGSSNQRVIDLHLTRKHGVVTLFTPSPYLQGFEPPKWG